MWLLPLACVCSLSSWMGPLRPQHPAVSFLVWLIQLCADELAPQAWNAPSVPLPDPELGLAVSGSLIDIQALMTVTSAELQLLA